MTDDHWREMIRSMHKIEMDMVVIQEVFRHQAYIGSSTTVEDYPGKAFILLYVGRMNMRRKICSCSTYLESEWHKRVAKELWDMYGHHESFYAFYVSEEKQITGNQIHNAVRKEKLK